MKQKIKGNAVEKYFEYCFILFIFIYYFNY